MAIDDDKEEMLEELKKEIFPYVYKLNRGGNDNLIMAMIADQFFVFRQEIRPEPGSIGDRSYVKVIVISSLTIYADQFISAQANRRTQAINQMTKNQVEAFLLKYPYGHRFHDEGQRRLNFLTEQDSTEDRNRFREEMGKYGKANEIAEAANVIAVNATAEAVKTTTQAKRANLIAWISAVALIATLAWTVGTYIRDRESFQRIDSLQTAVSEDRDEVKSLTRKVVALQHSSDLINLTELHLREVKLSLRLPISNEEIGIPETPLSTTPAPSTPAPESKP